MAMPYEKNRETSRPFRIWDASKRKHMVGKNYSDLHRAHNGALVEARWAKVDQALEVYDVRTGRLLGQYVRKEGGVGFFSGSKK